MTVHELVNSPRLTVENRALRMLAHGDTPHEISAATGLRLDDIDKLRRDFPGTTKPTGRLRLPSRGSAPCPQDLCNQPPRPGRYPVGWIKVQISPHGPTWYCSWPCLIRYAIPPKETV